MSRRLILVGLLVLSGLAAGIWLALSQQKNPVPAAVDGLIVTPDPGFSRATGPIPLSFPKDDGPHPEFQTEWWYYTGNLQTAGGQHFGFELTFFRRALQSPAAAANRASDLGSDQIYMAHLALTDVEANHFSYFERFSRGAAGLAGARGLSAYSVWLEDWQVSQTGPDQFQLAASSGDVALDLTLKSLKGRVLQGDQGYSQKGPGVGNASIYTSQTRLQTSGSLKSGGQKYTVSGLSWMDHEFSTSALSSGQVGWDWFALQLDDGSELTVYAIRRTDGTLDPFARGSVIRPDGSLVTLKPADFGITSTGEWSSPASGGKYPSGWVIKVPGEGIDLTVSPYIADQELHLSFTYWEGAVKVVGKKNGVSVAGSGYVELTGYARSLAGQF